VVAKTSGGEADVGKEPRRKGTAAAEPRRGKRAETSLACIRSARRPEKRKGIARIGGKKIALGKV